MRQLNKCEFSRVVGMGIISPDLPEKQNSAQPVDEKSLKKIKESLTSAI